jgi:hypothetical protein
MKCSGRHRCFTGCLVCSNDFDGDDVSSGGIGDDAFAEVLFADFDDIVLILVPAST